MVIVEQFNPSRLRAARQINGFTFVDLAKRSGVSAADISSYERELAGPGALPVHRLAAALRVPVGFLLHPDEIEKPPSEIIFYRKRAQTAKRLQTRMEWGGAFFAEFIQFMEGRNLLRLKEPELPDLSELTPEATAIALRKHLGFQDGPLASVVGLLEYLGIWVHTLQSVDTKKVDAFSFWWNEHAHVYLNPAKKDPFRQRFDCCHEAFHLISHDVRDEQSDQENEANRFAAEFLVPANAWLDEAPRRGRTIPYRYLEAKARWKVSVACLLFRSRTLGLLKESEYRYAMQRYSEMGWRQGEPNPSSYQHEEPELLPLCLSRLQEAGLTLDQVGEQLRWGSDLMAIVLGVVKVSPLPADVVSFTAPHPKRPAEHPVREAAGEVIDLLSWRRT
ncbi:MAG: Zn-dependent peptidase ImmA (M78 family)/transcriptional regulator with XRE-family HTH domain [Myxococcota bacterium]